MTHKFRAICAACCLLCMTTAVSASQVESGSVYCFTQEDFSRAGEPCAGICLTELPREELGAVFLGSRRLRPGDVLTAEQAAQMTFAPAATTWDSSASVGYLPIFASGMGERTTMSIAIRGREDKPPVAEDSVLETYKNLEVNGRLRVSDPEQQPLQFAVVRQPKRGTVTLREDGSFTYTPKKNKIGIDSFVYTASDPAGKTSREATVTITILKPADAVRYADTAGKDCCFSAEWMKNTGIFTGETVGDSRVFSPEKTVTQGEFLTMLVKTMEVPVDPETVYTGFRDVPQWLQPYLAAAVRSGLAAALPHGEDFSADAPVTGQTAAELLCAALDLKTETAAALSGEEHSPAVAAAQAEGFSLAENQLLTRGDTAQMMYRISQLAGNYPRLQVWQ